MIEIKIDSAAREGGLTEAQRVYAIRQMEGTKLKRHKGKYIDDYFTCGNCGTTADVIYDYCFRCGFRLLWDNPRCLTKGENQ